ncbi:MAG: hypothetical protein PWP65_1932 [Clostridia bacterium]|nr:hypothetical protein [Clostridia bacterium]
MKEEIRVSAEDLKSFVTGVLTSLALPLDEGRIIADTLVEADLRGAGSHGVMRLVTYVRRVKAGGIKVPAEVRMIQEGPATALLDGGAGFGQIAAFRAAEVAMQKALNCGVGVVGVKNSSHFGRAGYYAEMIAKRDMIGVCMSNASPRLAPWGGKEAMLGNNPFSIAVPSTDRIVVLDMATSVAALGKMRLAAQQGLPIPPGWALDREGNPTTDPLAAVDGILLPFGEHKGYGITLMVGFMCGILTGACWDPDVKPIDDFARTQGLGHLLMAVRIDSFMLPQRFKERVAEAIERLKNCPKTSGQSEIFLPGEQGSIKRELYLKQGVPLAKSTVASLNKLAEELRVPPLKVMDPFYPNK